MPKRVKYLLGLLVSLLSFANLMAQDLSSRQLTDEDGLPSMTVYTSLQDKEGYMWFGTANGVCRYDGYAFQVYNDKTLKDHEILHLAIDSWNRVWFSNLSGQLFYISESQIKECSLDFVSIEGGLKDFGIIENMLWVKIKQPDRDHLGKTSFVYKVGYLKLTSQISIDSLTFYDDTFYNTSNFLINGNRISFKADNNIFQSSSEAPSKFSKTTIDHPLAKIGSWGKLSEYKGRIFIANQNEDNEGQIFELGQPSTRLFYKEQNFLINTMIWVDSALWSIAADGIYIFENTINKNPEAKIIFKGTYCNSIMRDRENNIWIGTAGKGIIMIPSNTTFHFSADNNALPTEEAGVFFYDKERQRLITGLSGGYIAVTNAEGNWRPVNLENDHAVRDIILDGSNRYWLVSDFGVSVLDQDLVFKASVPLGGLKTIAEDRNKNIWLGSSNSSFLIENYKKHDFLNNKPRTAANKLPKRTYALLEDHESNIWIGTTTGIHIYSSDRVYDIQENGKTTSYNVADLLLSADSSIWVATLGGGLLQIKEKKIIEKINIEHGLSSNTCKRLFEKDDKLWIATNKGVNVLNLKTGKIEIINKTDGLPSNEINDITFFNGQMWIGTPKGLVSFPEDTKHQNDVPPPIHITALKIWDRDTLVADTLHLKHNQNNLHIEFVGLGYRSQGNITYKYRLSEIDKDWVKTDTRFVRYPTVNPGNYLFEVIAINEDGTESPDAASIQFIIAPPWWQTWWARLGVFLLLVSSIGMIFYLRFHRIREKEKKEQAFKEQLNALRNQALQTQMNPHFIFNALNAIQHFLTTNAQEQAMGYLSKFARLIRIIFEQSKKKRITLEEEIEFLDHYIELEKLRFKNKVEVKFLVKDALKKEKSEILIPPLLIQPIIENAFKHGLFHKKGKGHLNVVMEKSNGHLICKVHDDGVGRAKAEELSTWKDYKRESSGLKTAKERLALTNNHNHNHNLPAENIKIIDLADSDGVPQGTKIIMKIKFDQL